MPVGTAALVGDGIGADATERIRRGRCRRVPILHHPDTMRGKPSNKPCFHVLPGAAARTPGFAEYLSMCSQAHRRVNRGTGFVRFLPLALNGEPHFSVMASDHFYLFTAWASFSLEAQEVLKAAKNAQDIVSIAAKNGYIITQQQLIHYARQLQEPHWIWNQLDPQGQSAFFGSSGAETARAWRIH